MQLTEHMSWLPDVGATTTLGVDGISRLAGRLDDALERSSPSIASFDPINKRVREYYIAMLLLEVGHARRLRRARPLPLLHLLRIELIPMALLIGVWGSANRVYAAVKFFLYTLAGRS